METNLWGTTIRPYQGSHPWITFQVRFDRFPIEAWVALGECQSKCDHLAGTPLKPATARELCHVYLARGARSTTAIEGNTLTEEQVRRAVEGDLRLPESQEYLQTEVENIIRAFDRVERSVMQPEGRRLTPELLRQYNRLVLAGLRLADEVVPGEIPTHGVGVGNYRAAPRVDCEHLLERLCDWINQDWKELHSVGINPIGAGLLRAILAHLYFEWIHPFGDGNGRTGRLLEFHVLCASGAPTIAAHLLSNHYSKTRSEYYRHLESASRSGGDVVPFIMYAVTGFRDGLREQIGVVREQHEAMCWESMVNEALARERSAKGSRWRVLLVEAFKAGGWVQVSELADLSPAMAREYAGKTGKTITRDINSLIAKQLLKRRPGDKVVANVELIRAFRPWCADETPPGVLKRRKRLKPPRWSRERGSRDHR